MPYVANLHIGTHASDALFHVLRSHEKIDSLVVSRLDTRLVLTTTVVVLLPFTQAFLVNIFHYHGLILTSFFL